MTRKLRAADLFCGARGTSAGAEATGECTVQFAVSAERNAARLRQLERQAHDGFPINSEVIREMTDRAERSKAVQRLSEWHFELSSEW
jgi:site-specific DNA-cytosine methylase